MSSFSVALPHTDPDLKHGAVVSAGIHLTLLTIAFLGIFQWFERTDPEPMVVTLETALPITHIDNLPSAPQPLVHEHRKTPTHTAAPTTPPSTRSTPAERVKPPKAPTTEPRVKTATATPPALTKVEEPAPTPDTEEEAFKKTLEKLEEERRARQAATATTTAEPAVAAPNTTIHAPPMDLSQPMSMSELTAIANQFIQCWNLPAGAANDYTLKVAVDVALNLDGSLISVALAPEQQNRYGSDMVFQAAADSAMRAVRKCNPIKNLPTDKYNSWKEMRLNFDPSMALY
jgi:outer membrane biosynthesis protein TonB